MTDTDQNNKDLPVADEALDLFFDAARKDVTAPSDALLARIMEDAEDERFARVSAQAAQEAAQQADSRSRANGGRFTALWRVIGGWPAATGLVAATMAGVMIGYSPPSAVSDFSTDLLSEALPDTPSYFVTELLAGYDSFLIDG